MIRMILLCLFCGIPVIWGEESYKAHDYMGKSDKNKTCQLALELLKDAKLKLRQVTGIMHEHGESVAFEVGNIIGQIREKYKRMLETYRDSRNRFVKRAVLQGPAVRDYRPLHFIINMEFVHIKEVEIDHLVDVLESIPKKLLDTSDPLMELKMKYNQTSLPLRSRVVREELLKKEQDLKEQYKEEFMKRKLAQFGP